MPARARASPAASPTHDSPRHESPSAALTRTCGSKLPGPGAGQRRVRYRRGLRSCHTEAAPEGRGPPAGPASPAGRRRIWKPAGVPAGSQTPHRDMPVICLSYDHVRHIFWQFVISLSYPCHNQTQKSYTCHILSSNPQKDMIKYVVGIYRVYLFWSGIACPCHESYALPPMISLSQSSSFSCSAECSPPMKSCPMRCESHFKSSFGNVKAFNSKNSNYRCHGARRRNGRRRPCCSMQFEV